MPTFTREELEAKNAKELKRMCVYELDIPGMTKKPKPVVINAIMEKFGRGSGGSASISKPAAAGAAPLTALEGTFTSHLDKPGAVFGNRNTTTIRVSNGASSGNFPVSGRKVSEVSELLREVLNVDRMSNGLVNGKPVDSDYVLKDGDTLEFMKPAGKKGC